jgi:hypothetical protein
MSKKNREPDLLPISVFGVQKLEKKRVSAQEIRRKGLYGN